MKVKVIPTEFVIFDEEDRKIGAAKKRDEDCFDVEIKACVSTGGISAIGTQMDYVLSRADRNLVDVYKEKK